MLVGAAGWLGKQASSYLGANSQFFLFFLFKFSHSSSKEFPRLLDRARDAHSLKSKSGLYTLQNFYYFFAFRDFLRRLNLECENYYNKVSDDESDLSCCEIWVGDSKSTSEKESLNPMHDDVLAHLSFFQKNKRRTHVSISFQGQARKKWWYVTKQL